MATIAINDLNVAGYSLFADNESYLQELSSNDDLNISGGISTTIIPIVTIVTSTYPIYYTQL